MKYIFILLIPTLVLAGNSIAAPRPKSNIVFILADDLGFAEISANGSDRYKTANIDSLAKTGMAGFARTLDPTTWMTRK